MQGDILANNKFIMKQDAMIWSLANFQAKIDKSRKVTQQIGGGVAIEMLGEQVALFQISITKLNCSNDVAGEVLAQLAKNAAPKSLKDVYLEDFCDKIGGLDKSVLDYVASKSQSGNDNKNHPDGSGHIFADMRYLKARSDRNDE